MGWQILKNILQASKLLTITDDLLRPRLIRFQLGGHTLLKRPRLLLATVVDDQVTSDAIKEGTQIFHLPCATPLKAQPGFLPQVRRQLVALHLAGEEAQQFARMALELTFLGIGVMGRAH